MDLHHQFEVGAKVEDVWPAFLDMPRLAPCMPGAEITEVIDDRNVKGAAKVKVGPVNLRFAGTGELTEVDDDNRSAQLMARGSDAKGRGNAEADIRFQLAAADGDRTSVEVTTALRLTGSVAQYGRASGLIDEIANQLIAEFVSNLEAELATVSTADPAPTMTPESELDADLEPGAAGVFDDERPGAAAPASPVGSPTPVSGSVSGIKVFVKALMAMIRKRLGRS